VADVHDDKNDDQLFGEEVFADDAAVRIGRKVIEMADRITDVARALPGAQATWHFDIDDRRYKVIVTLVE